MKDKISKKRKKYAVALLAATAATVATSFSPSAPWVLASKTDSDPANPNLPPDFSVPVYNELDFDPDVGKIKVHYYNVQAGDNVAVTRNTFTEKDYDGNNVTYNNFIVKANDTLVEDSDDIVVDKGNSENPEKGTENGVTRKYKLKLSETLKNELKASVGGGGGAAPSKLADGTNTTVSGDGTDGNKYTVNIKPDLTGITSITGNTLTLNGGTTAVAIGNDGVNVGGKKITNIKEGDVSENSTDAVTGKQLHATNEKVEGKLDKTAERHIKPEAYTVNDGTVTLKYVDANGKVTDETATISGLNPVKSVASGDANTLTVENNNGAITVTPVVATNVTDAGNANKLTTASVVNTAINNATNPLANKALSNITDDGKKVITGLSTEVVQGNGITVKSNEDATTGKKTYTISAAKLNFANGTNTTVDGDGTKDKPYKYNVNPALTGITSITGDTGLTFTGAGTAVTINATGVNVGGAKVTNLADAALTNSSTDAVTGKQLHTTNEKVEGKLDKTAERHVKPQAYSVENGTVTLKYVDANGKETTETATINGLNPVKSVASGDESKLTVANNNGDITVTPVVATDITKADDANKLATAGVVNTAITNATNPLANKNLSNITDDGKKVITGLGTEVVQGDGVTVTSSEDAATGKKTYTISATAVQPIFANGTNTTVEGDGTPAKPYTYNVNPALTGITSITGDTGLTFTGAGKTVTINNDGVNVGGAKVTNLADAALTDSSSDAVTGKQLHTTNEKVEGKLDKTAERHIKPEAYTVNDGTVTLKYVDANGKVTDETATISGLNPVKSVASGDANTLTVENNNGAITVTPVVATNVTDAGNANKLTTASVVNTAINNATNPLANKALSNITDDGKKVITGLSTEVVQGNGVTVTSSEDAATGKKTYTISANAVQPNFANGTNTTVEGDGTAGSPYKYNVNPALTGIMSITNATTADGDGTKLTIDGDKLSVVNKKGADTTTVTIGKDGIDAGGKTITNVADPTGNKDAANKAYVDAQKWGLKVQNGDAAAEAVTPKEKAITLKASADTTDNEATPKKGLLITKDDQGNITVGLDKATRTALDNAVNGNQLINERVTSPVIFVDKDGNQVFKTADGKFTTKDGAEITDTNELAKIHTKVNATNPMTLDNVASAVKDLTGTTYLDKLAEGAKQGSKVANSAVNVTDLHAATTAILDKPITFIGDNDTNDKIERKLGETLKIHGDNNITVKKDAANADTLNVALQPTLTGITSITNATTADGDGTKLTIDGDKLSVVNKKGADTTTVTIGKDGIDAGGKTITNVADPTGNKDAANKAYVDAQKWGLKVQNGTDAAADVTPNTGKITLKTGTDTSDDATKPKKGLVIAKDDQGNITLGLEKADRTTLDNAANLGNTASDGRDGQAGKNATGVVAGSAGAQGPTGQDGLNGKDLTNKVNALRNGEAGTVVYTNAAGDRLVKANDGQYYKADEVEPNGEKKPGATAVDTKDVIASLVSPNGTTTGATTKLSNIADGAISKDSKDAVNGSQLFNERVTSPVIFVDKDGNQVFKTAEGKFVTKEGTAVADADLDKVHTKVNAAKPMTLDNVASAVNNLTGTTYLDKLEEGAKQGSKVANSAVNVTDLHAATTAILDKPITFIGDNDTNDKIERKLGETLKIHGDNNITVKKDAANADTLNVALQPTLTGITSITNATTADGDGTKLTIDGDKLSVVNKKGADTTTVTIGKDGIDAGGKTITNVADPTGNKDAANKEYVDAQKWGLKVQNGTDAAADVTPNTGKITLKTGTDTSDDATKPKKGLVIAKDDQGNITLGLEKADRTTLDNAANLGNTASDGRDGQAGKNATGVVAGSAGAQGPTGQDGLNGKDLTSKVNALRNGEAGTVVYTNAAGDRLVKANDGQYYKANEVGEDGQPTPGATPVDKTTVIASLVSPDGKTTGATTKLSNIADGAISKDSKDAVNGSQLFNERVTSPVIFVDKDGNQVFKTANGKFVTKEGTAVADADLDKVHTKVNAEKPMTLDNVASAVNNLTGTTYLDKLAEGVKADNKVANSAVNVTDLHAATTAILDKPITFIGDNDTNDKIERKLGETLKIHGDNNITVKKDAANADTLNVALQPTLTGITSITNATTADGDGTKLTIDGDKLSVVNKKGADTTTVTIGKDGIDAGGKTITNVADPTGNKDAANKAYVDAQKWGLKVQNGDAAAEAVTPKEKAITLKASADTTDNEATPKKGLLITKDDQGNITVGLDKATRTALDNAVNGNQLINERVTSPVIFVDKDGNQVFKTADGKFTTKDGAEITNADDLAKIHTKVNATKAMTLDNVASALGEPAQDADYLAKLKEAKEGNTVNNSAVNVTDLHNTANAIVEKGLKFKGNLGEVITKKLGEELDIVGEGTVAETVATAANNIRTKNVGGKLEIGLVQDLTGITSITGGAANNDTKIELGKTGLKVTNTVTPDAGGAPETKTITIGKDGINADGTKITNVATPTDKADAANKEYVDAQKWGLKVQNGTDAAADVTPNTGKITLKTGTDTSDDATKPKKGLVIAKDDQGNITLGLEKADRTTLDNAANLGNTASDGRDGKAGKDTTGVVAGSAGAQGPTGQDGLNGKDLTNKVNALRNGEAGTVVYTNAAGDRLVKANDGQYYKADEVEPNGEKKQGATAVPTKDVIASLVSPDGKTTSATNKLSNIADGTVSSTSKDAVNGSQLFNERVTSPVIFVDKDGNQVFKTADGKFVTKEGTAVADADLDKVHTKVNAEKPMTLDNVASAVNNLTGNTYLDKLAEGAKQDSKVANSAVNVTDLHSTANALVTKGLDFKGNLGDAIHKNLGETLEIVGEGTVATDATTAANNIRTKKTDDGKLEIGLVKDLKNITSITNAAPVDPTQPDAAKVASTTLTINGDALTVENKQADGAISTVTIGKDGIDAGGKTITNVADPTNGKDAANKEYVDAQKWGLKVQNGTDAAADVTPNTGKITLKTGTDTSDDATKPKKGLVIAKDDQGNITLGLEKADRTTLDNAANLGNTASDGRDGQAGKNATGVVAGSAGAQGPTGQDGLNGKDLTNKVNALRNGEAGTVVYTNAAGDRLVKANDGNYYKANEVGEDGQPTQGATPVDKTTVIASLVSPDGKTSGATTKLSNIADGAISTTSKDAVNGSQLFNERVTSPVIFVDKDGKQVFKTAEGKFVTKEGTAVADADLDKVHTKVNAEKPMTLDNVASAVNNLTGNTYLDKLAEGAKADNKVANSAVNVTDLHNTANAIVEKGLKFKGNLGDAIHKNLGETLEIVGEGTVATDATTAANNIRTKKTDDGKLEIGLVKDLTGITSITGGVANNDTKIELGKTGLKVTNTVTPDAGGAPETKTITIGKDGINADGTKITNVATPTDKADAANKEYVDAQKWGLKVQNGTDAAADVTPNTGKITLKTGTDTSDDATKPKKGLVIAKDDQGNITLGLEKADRTTLDNAANLGNTASDGRDGQAGKNATGVVAGSAGAQGPTGQDGLNGKDLTNKVNALRNGEAGTVVYTNAAGDRLVKANDGKYYKADEVKPDGNVKTETENGGKAPVAVTPEARLVSPDGTTTGAANKLSNIANGTISESSKDAVNGSQLFNERVTNPTIFVDKDGNQVFKTTDGKFVDKNGAEVPADKIHTKLNAGAPMTLDNVASAVENATVPNAADPNNVTFKEKLAAAAGDVATKYSAVNVEDLHKATADTSDALVTKGLNFQGNLGDAIHKDLGAKLDIVGEGTVAAGAPTAADNIRTKNVDGKLEIGIVKDLKNITSITNAATADGDGTKLTIDGDKLSVVNKKGTDKTTVTIGKDGINAGGTKITNVAEGAISKDSTDVVIGKQLHVTNEKVSNLEETKLNKTDDVHVKAGTYTVDDTTGTVALPLVKGDADTATSKNVTISGIVTHAALSNTMDAYELHIAGDKDSKATTTLKKGLVVRGAENFTPDAATKEKGINIQATATEGGVNIKLSDTLTKMKGITFTPAENSKEAVSLTSNGLDNGGHTITNVAAGRNDTDVVNVAQLKGIANVVGDVNNRLNRSSAQSAALAGLQTLQYDPLEPTQISAGVGYYKGSTALALGVGHYKNESTLFHVGASVNGHGDEVMANASVTWKFGSRATESAVKDTYRQGPISASYTLQDKVSALEAQNQIQSEKINAQNQVIEDLKAQLAEVLQYIRK